MLWRTLGRAAALHAFAPDAPIAVLTTGLPTKGTPNEAALRAVMPSPIAVVLDLNSSEALTILRTHFPTIRRLGTLYCPAETNMVNAKIALESTKSSGWVSAR